MSKITTLLIVKLIVSKFKSYDEANKHCVKHGYVGIIASDEIIQANVTDKSVDVTLLLTSGKKIIFKLPKKAGAYKI